MQNIVLSQQFIITGAIFSLAVLCFIFLTIKERRPRESFNTPLLPTIPLMMVSGIVGLISLVHLINLLGFNTGR